MSSRLSPSYIIPVGTQVVLKRNHPVVGDARTESGERVLKKAGSAGEIRSAPMTHDDTYEVHFADGHQVLMCQHFSGHRIPLVCKACS
jgi:hypothetical protein